MVVRKVYQQMQGQRGRIWVWTVCPLGGVQSPATQNSAHAVPNSRAKLVDPITQVMRCVH